MFFARKIRITPWWFGIAQRLDSLVGAGKPINWKTAELNLCELLASP
jgi:hypothetical protein